MSSKYRKSNVLIQDTEDLALENKDLIKSLYKINRGNEDNLFQYLNQNLPIVALLIEAATEIDKFFVTLQKSLELTYDPEYESDGKLIVYFAPSEPPEKAIDIYKSFQKNWWYQNWQRANGNLLFIIRYQ
jgi:hypothetical protein